MNIVFDIGSNYTKAGVFKEDELIFSTSFKNNDNEKINEIFDSYSDIETGIISSVSELEEETKINLAKSKIPFIYLNLDINIPIKNKYKSPTLGKDRLAAAVGANSLFPNQNLLIIDFGTAITIDIINKNNEYIGGNISPGLASRFWALNQKSDYLPLLLP